ncbi:hypothetical protein LAZ67_1001152 [Cordylochernes scorpioides]|uniref:Amino acid transporter transmembrane domain-containing protein n=1 Tax=Cordylochernes scorpioides TaxID=51811 RepID=A0ABY6JYG2_9ARAC|nr:hypothetical protein LAZ67_1001152 [Cordylochernes scorpioides]
MQDVRPKDDLKGSEGDPEKGDNGDTGLKGGITLVTACIFIIGEIAGGGCLTLPRALHDAEIKRLYKWKKTGDLYVSIVFCVVTGWAGLFSLILLCFNAGVAGVHIAKCWMILEERWTMYRGRYRHPYPAIGGRAVAPWMRTLVSIFVNLCQLGAATVFLLLSAQIIQGVLGVLTVCQWILILAAILCPLMPVAIVAMSTTLVAVTTIIVMIVKDGATRPAATFDIPTFSSFFLAFGAINFAFGGTSAFPTYQNDMKNRSKFIFSVIIAFTCILLLYAPLAGVGYAVYGQAVMPNVIDNMPKGVVQLAVQILISLHLFFGFLLVVNTPSQEIEEHLNVPHRFGIKRIMTRVGILLVVVFVAMTIPRFDKVLSLVGATVSTSLSFIFPPLFYLLLCRQKGEWPER